MTERDIIHMVEDQEVDIPESWNNRTGVMSDKAKCTINSFILCLWSQRQQLLPCAYSSYI